MRELLKQQRLPIVLTHSQPRKYCRKHARIMNGLSQQVRIC
ncbi:hypothetical protein [Solobacterium moorei]|nr:hypothetical protein [Solobacterium moorei]